MMNFLKVFLSICHSFRSTGQSGRMKGLKCLQVLDQCSRRQQSGHAVRLTLLTLLLGRNEIKLHQCHLWKTEPFEGVTKAHLGKIEPLLGIFEPRLGRITPLLGITKSLLGNTKPDLGLNKCHLGKFRRFRNCAAVEVKTPSIDQLSTKAVAYEQSYVSGCYLVENYASFTKVGRENLTKTILVLNVTLKDKVLLLATIQTVNVRLKNKVMVEWRNMRKKRWPIKLVQRSSTMLI